MLVAVLSLTASNDLKQVLIIGDSISIGYTPFVAKALKEKAIVIHNKGNAGDTRNGINNIEAWIGDTKWDVIHFNFGLHDLCYRALDANPPRTLDKVNGTRSVELEDYRKNLEKIIVTLKKTNAKLIFATTSHVPPKEKGRFAGDEKRYNKVAIEVMKKHNIQINPLYETSLKVHPLHGRGEDDVHYTKLGSEILSKDVIKSIELAL